MKTINPLEIRASGGYGSVDSLNSDSASTKLVMYYSKKYEMEQASFNSLDEKSSNVKFLRGVGVIGSAIGASGTVMGAIPPSNDDQASIALSIKNDSHYTVLLYNVEFPENHSYVSSNFSLLGPGDNNTLALSINHDYNFGSTSVDLSFYLKMVIAYADGVGGSDGFQHRASEITIHVAPSARNSTPVWNIYSLSSVEYGTLQRPVEFQGGTAALGGFFCNGILGYPSFGIFMQNQDVNSKTLPIVITPNYL